MRHFRSRRKPRPCDTNAGCRAGAYCAAPLGQCDGPGACGDRACTTHCDCYELPFTTACPFLCVTCGSFWTCVDGKCVEGCGPIPPQPPCDVTLP